MAAVYFHIPFCKRICAYCDFHRFADLRTVEKVIEAMHAEIDETIDFLNDRKIRTIYFGGGTPSLLPPRELQRLTEHLRSRYDLAELEEVTVEVNPDDVSEEYVNELVRTEINRISIGIQSFDDRLLQLMNRRHNGRQAAEAVRLLQSRGYKNITVDLIFGFNGFGDEVVKADLQKIAELGIQHVSAYHLTIEPDTRLGRMAARGEFFAIPEERSEQLFGLIHNVLTDNGFEHYEVSNYARSGFRSRHNSSYWTGTEYLGIGTGAHSFNGEQRRWCSQQPAGYLLRRCYESEALTERDRFNELVMTSLRRVEGLDLRIVAERFGAVRAERLLKEAEAMESFGVRVVGKGLIQIPAERMLISDAVIERMFEV